MATPWTELLVLVLPVVGLAMQDDEDPISRLTEKVRLATSGEPVEFDRDRDDEIGALAAAIGDLVAARDDHGDRIRTERYRRELFEITTDDELTTEEKVDQLLALGVDRLGVDSGLITQIDEETGRYTVETVVGDDFVEEGTVTDLSETFCRKTVAIDDDVIAIFDAVAEGYEDDPGSRLWGIGCYLGAKIMIDDELYGTLCFVAKDALARPFTPAEKHFVDVMGRWLGQVFERRKHVETLELAMRGLDAVPIGIAITDPDLPDNPVVMTNPAFEAVTGYSTAEATGRNCRFLQGPDTDPESVAELRRAIDAREPTTVELCNYRKDGTTFWNRVSIAPIRDASGEVSHFVGFLEDVTARVERERALERQRTFMDDVLDAIDDVFYVIEEDGTYRRWNESFRQVTGYDDAEIERMHAFDFFPESAWPTVASGIEEVFETGTGLIEAPLLTADGELIDYEFVAVEIEDPDGQSILTGIGRDISERNRYEAELERTMDMLQQAGRIAKFGGWELDATTDPPEMTWTAELYDIHGLSQDERIDVERALALYHPDDREFISDRIQRTLETGEPYDMEVRALTTNGDVRWVRARGEAVSDGGSVVKVRGAVQDITANKEREFALETLHESTRQLLKVEELHEAGRIVVEAAESTLDVDAVGLYCYDADANELDPIAVSTTFDEYVPDAPTSVGPDADSPLWDAFVTGRRTIIGGHGGTAEPLAPGTSDAVETATDEDDRQAWFTTTDVDPATAPVGTTLAIPVGEYGIFVGVAADGDLSDETRRLAETLVASAEAAIERIHSEATLRERDAELAAQNERLRRQIAVTETIRSVDRILIGATNQPDLEDDVCEKLAQAADVAFAWIGEFDVGGERLVPRTWAGTTRGYLDAEVFGRTDAGPEPAVAAAERGEPVVVENVARNVQSEPWRRHAVTANVQSVVAVPLALEEYGYGVLGVYATEPNAFGDLERTVYAELGESVANAITTVSTKRALHADTVLSLTLRLAGGADPLGSIARAANCEVRFEGLAAFSDDRARMYVRTAGATTATIRDVLADRTSVLEYRLVSESSESDVFEVTVHRPSIVTTLVRHGGHPQSITADPDGMDVVVDVPVGTDVRAFVGMLGEEFDVELLARQPMSRSLQTPAGLAESILDDLTPRQREVLETAYLAGFFNWPRDTTGEELGEILDVSQPTVNRHIRLAERQIMHRLLSSETDDE